MANPTQTTLDAVTGTALDTLKTKVSRVLTSETVSFSDVLGVLDTAAETPTAIEPLAPKAVVLSKEQLDAINSMVEVMATATSATPTERRGLTVDEIRTLIRERLVLDQVEAVIKARKEAARTAGFNALDVANENLRREAGVSEPAPIDKDRHHYLLPGALEAPGEGRKFTRELRTQAPVLDDDGLRAAEEAGLLTHEEYLDLTTQVRVPDEAKILLALRKNPSLVKALAFALKPGNTTASLYLRKA